MLERKWSDGPPVVVSPSSPTDVSRKSFSGGVDGVNVKQVHGGFLSSYILAEVVRNTFFKKGSRARDVSSSSCYFFHVQTLLVLQVLKIKFYMNLYLYGGVCSFLF